MADKLYICMTCMRDEAVRDDIGTRGSRLAVAVEAALLADADLAAKIALRRVECLNSCLSHCAVAFRSQGKMGLRFSRLEPENAAAVVEMASKYAASQDGNVAKSDWPEILRSKNTARIPVPPRNRAGIA